MSDDYGTCTYPKRGVLVKSWLGGCSFLLLLTCARHLALVVAGQLSIVFFCSSFFLFFAFHSLPSLFAPF